jgi:hypothetical protein
MADSVHRVQQNTLGCKVINGMAWSDAGCRRAATGIEQDRHLVRNINGSNNFRKRVLSRCQCTRPAADHPCAVVACYTSDLYVSQRWPFTDSYTGLCGTGGTGGIDTGRRIESLLGMPGK